MNNDYNNDYNNYNTQDDQKSSSQSGDQKEEIHFNEWDLGNSYGNYQNSNYYQPPYGNNQYEPPVLIDEAKEKQNLSRLGYGYAALSLITFAVALIIQIIVLAINPDIIKSTLFLNLITPVSIYIFALPVLLIIISKCEVNAPEKRRFGIGQWFICMIIGFGIMYIGSIIGNTVMDYISILSGYDYSNSLDTIVDNENLWVTFIFTVIIAPIGEEFVFRKLIIDRTQRYGGAVCILLSALMFGLMHSNFYQFFYCVGLGLILGYIYHRSGKLLPCILLHATINFMGGIVPSWLLPISEGLEKIDPEDTEALAQFMMNNLGGIFASMMLTLFMFASMALAVILLIALRKKIKLDRGEAQLPRSRAFTIIITSAGIAVMIVVYALEFALSLVP